MVCLRLGRPYPLKLFKGCVPQILLAPFLNTLTHSLVLKNNAFLSEVFRITVLILQKNEVFD